METLDIDNFEKVSIPSFIVLFVINRTLNVNEIGLSAANTLSNIVNVLKDTLIREQAQKILSLLIKDGIKLYMEKSFNEQKQARTIEIIFNQIILTNFVESYHKVIMYKTKDQNTYTNNNFKYHYRYQETVFNPSVPLTFSK